MPGSDGCRTAAPGDEQNHLGTPAAEVAIGLQVVGGGLPAGGGEELHHPEDEQDLWDLRGDRSGEEPADERDLAVVQGGHVAQRTVDRHGRQPSPG
jgi:hypothetical protein